MNPWNMMEIIHEDDDMDGFGMRSKDEELEEAYRKGCEHGFKRAMKKVKEMQEQKMQQREGGYGGGRTSSGMGERSEYPDFIYGEMGERRGRDSRGRYV